MGLRLNNTGSLLLRYQGGTIPTLKTSGSGALNPATTQTNVAHKLISMEGEFTIPLNDPLGFHGFEFFVPINIAGYVNWVSGTPNVLMNFGIKGGAGAGTRFYTGGPVILDVSFLYHLAIPLGDIQWAGTTDNALNAAGQPVKGNASGPELRLAATIVF